MNKIYANYFPKDFPARCCVEVSKLPHKAEIEIEAIALCKERFIKVNGIQTLVGMLYERGFFKRGEMMPYECGLKDVVIIFLKNLNRKEE